MQLDRRMGSQSACLGWGSEKAAPLGSPLYVHRSDDDGVSLGEPILLGGGMAGSSSACHGRGSEKAAPLGSPLYVHRSDDDGVSFDDPVFLGGLAGSRSACHGRGSGKAGPFGSPLYVHRSDDGVSFGEPVLVGGGMAERWARPQHARQRCKSPLRVELPQADKATVTTFAVQNLPRKTSLTLFVRALDEASFAGLYDFVYVPSKFGTYQNNGIGFVNFHSPIMAANFKKEWHKSKRFGMKGGCVLHVVAAALQGFHANVAKWGAGMKKADRVRSENCRPLVLRELSTHAAATCADTIVPSGEL